MAVVATGLELMGGDAAFRAELCDMIAATRLFADLEWKDVQALAGYVQCYRAPAGCVVYREGDAGNHMCLLVSGEVEIIKEDHEGKPRRMLCIGPGKTIGEMALVDGEPRSATCAARVDSVLLLLSKESYLKIMSERPGLAVQILSRLARLLSQRLRSATGQLVEFLDRDGSG